MADDKGGNDDEVALWRAVTKDVAPLKGKAPDSLLPLEVKTPPPSHKTPKPPLKPIAARSSAPRPDATLRAVKSRDMDAATLRRLRSGQIAIEARIDLHGMNKGQAREALIQTILAAHGAGRRCVLVITGKGRSGKGSDDWLTPAAGVLKQNVPLWLDEAPLRDIVLTAQPATPRDGGDGALYVYLRRVRG